MSPSPFSSRKDQSTRLLPSSLLNTIKILHDACFVYRLFERNTDQYVPEPNNCQSTLYTICKRRVSNYSFFFFFDWPNETFLRADFCSPRSVTRVKLASSLLIARCGYSMMKMTTQATLTRYYRHSVDYTSSSQLEKTSHIIFFCLFLYIYI